MYISLLDWIVIFGYLGILLILSWHISRTQSNRLDYFVAGRDEGPYKIATSVVATQCSTNSILGAPAFVAFAAGGGLTWLQYELAVPLAMLFIMIFLYPIFYQLKIISVYEYLERRFDIKTRLLLSGLFQLMRVFATAVTVYSISLVVELITGLSFFWSVLILGLVTIVYDVLGGIKATIYSDVLQMTILITVLLMVMFILIDNFGDLSTLLNNFSEDRKASLRFDNHGFGDGEDFAFWPMLIGGFFLYVSYYGCDQSQVQRELCARSQNDGQKILFINGIVRFPIVLLYCMVGVGIGAFASSNPNFLENIPTSNGIQNFNLAVPIFLMRELPIGLVGLSLVALFAAAMSSLDSVINSLSATTLEDFVRYLKPYWVDTAEKELLVSRYLTMLWGSMALALSFYVGDIASTVIVAINKIGSMMNGPVLGTFLLGIFTKRANGQGACIGLISGILSNLYFWVYMAGVSWLWWNVIGMFSTLIIGYLFSLSFPSKKSKNEVVWSKHFFSSLDLSTLTYLRYLALILWAFILFFFLLYSF